MHTGAGKKDGFFSVLICICLFALVFVLLPLSGYADDGIPLAVPKGEDKDATDVRIGQVQEWLEGMGYYHGDHTMKFDADTQYALYSFCQENGLPYTNDGVTQAEWDLLQSGGGKPAQGDEATPAYTDIAFGTTGDNVLSLQTRLKELGYYVGDNRLNPSVFDEGTQQAIHLFCETNSVSFTGEGAPASIQYILYSSGAVAYSEPEIKLSRSEKLAAYMTRQVPVFGSALPMFFLWICGVIIVVLILVLAVYFFVPNRDKTAEEASSNAVPQLWRKTMDNSSGVGLMAMEKLSASGNLLDFQIQYNGNFSNVQCVCKPTVTIGRGGGNNIVLNAGDVSASNAHCDLYYRGAVLMLRDHSSNGTYVNGRLIHKSECRLNSGDQIAIGAHLLVVQY